MYMRVEDLGVVKVMVVDHYSISSVTHDKLRIHSCVTSAFVYASHRQTALNFGLLVYFLIACHLLTPAVHTSAGCLLTSSAKRRCSFYDASCKLHVVEFA